MNIKKCLKKFSLSLSLFFLFSLLGVFLALPTKAANFTPYSSAYGESTRSTWSDTVSYYLANNDFCDTGAGGDCGNSEAGIFKTQSCTKWILGRHMSIYHPDAFASTNLVNASSTFFIKYYADNATLSPLNQKRLFMATTTSSGLLVSADFGLGYTSILASDDAYTANQDYGWKAYHLNSAGVDFLSKAKDNSDNVIFYIRDAYYDYGGVSPACGTDTMYFEIGDPNGPHPEYAPFLTIEGATPPPPPKDFFDYGITSGISYFTCTSYIDFKVYLQQGTTTPGGFLGFNIEGEGCDASTTMQYVTATGPAIPWVRLYNQVSWTPGTYEVCMGYTPLSTGQRIIATSSITIASPESFACQNYASTTPGIHPNILDTFFSSTSLVQMLTGKNPHDQACTAEEWATPDPSFFTLNAPALNFVKLKCRIYASGWSFLDIAVMQIKFIYNSFTSIVGSLFPFNIPYHVKICWDDSATGEMSTSFAILNQRDAGGNVFFVIPAQWSGSNATTTNPTYASTSVAVIGPTALNSDPSMSRFFAGFKILTTFIMWLLWLLGLCVAGWIIYNDAAKMYGLGWKASTGLKAHTPNIFDI